MNTPTKALPANDYLRVMRNLEREYPMDAKVIAAYVEYLGDGICRLAAQDAALSAPQAGGECPRCNGVGYVTDGFDGQGDEQCDACDGTGKAAPPSAPPDGEADLVSACLDLRELVEGKRGHRWADHGLRLKDTVEWVRFYNIVSRLTRSAGPQGEVGRVRCIGGVYDVEWTAHNMATIPHGASLYTHPATRETGVDAAIRVNEVYPCRCATPEQRRLCMDKHRCSVCEAQAALAPPAPEGK
jgi:hypothetical protein